MRSMHPVNAPVRSPEVPPPHAESIGTRSRPPRRTLRQTVVAPAAGRCSSPTSLPRVESGKRSWASEPPTRRSRSSRARASIVTRHRERADDQPRHCQSAVGGRVSSTTSVRPPFLASRAIVLLGLGAARFAVSDLRLGSAPRASSHAGLLGWDAGCTRGSPPMATRPGQRCVAFLPLLPVLANHSGRCRNDGRLSLIIVANIACLAALVVLYRSSCSSSATKRVLAGSVVARPRTAASCS